MALVFAAALPEAGATPPMARHATFDSGCDQEINLQAAGGPMEHVAVRDQANENECYAEAAAQMIDAWRFSHGDSNTGHQTSGIALALRTNSDLLGTGVSRRELTVFGHRVLSTHEAGEACMAVDTARRHGSCDQSSVLAKFGNGNISVTVARLRHYYDRYQAWREQHDTLAERIRVIVSGEQSRRRQVSCEISERLLEEGVASELAPPVAVIERLLDESNPLAYLEGMMTHACTGEATIRPALPSCVRDAFVNPESAYRGVRERLISRRQPVAIGFCSGMVSQGREFENSTLGRLPAMARLAAPLTCRPHQALVIGLRRHAQTGKCQFLVRNSLGSACAPRDYSSDWECNAGSVWIDAQNLSLNTYGYSALE